MFGKFSLRAGFLVMAGWICGEGVTVREVVNPRRQEKVRVIARWHGIDDAEFERVCWWLSKVWPSFP
jgi:hypothetical protein